MRQLSGKLWMLTSLLVLLFAGCGGEDGSDQTPQDEFGDEDVESMAEEEEEVDPTAFVIGYAERDISPPVGTILGGFGGPAQNRGITDYNDPLMGQVLYLSNNAGQAFMVISVDTAGYFFEFGDWGPGIKQLRETIEEKLEGIVHLPPENILVGASHSHAATDLVGFWQAAGEGVPLEVLELYLTKISDAAVEAVESAVEGEIFVAEGELVGYTGRDSDCSEIIDNTVSVLQARDLEGQPLATLVNYAKHPTTLPYENTVASADFIWGFREETLLATGAPGMYLQGFVAAVHGGSSRVSGADSFEKAYAMGELISQTALDTLDQAEKVEEYRIYNLETLYSCETSEGYLYDTYHYLNMPKRSIEDLGDELLVKEIPVSWHKVGSVEFAVFPGEGTPEYSYALRERMTGNAGFIVGLGNDCLGYILDPESVAADPSGQLEGYEMLMDWAKKPVPAPGTRWSPSVGSTELTRKGKSPLIEAFFSRFR